MSRIVVMELEDVEQEDLLRMAIQSWNTPDREEDRADVRPIHWTSFPTKP